MIGGRGLPLWFVTTAIMLNGARAERADGTCPAYGAHRTTILGFVLC